MLLPPGIALLVALIGSVVAAGEVLAARRGRRPVRVPVLAGATTVAVFAVATACLLGSSLPGPLGMPRRYATYAPQPVVQPEVLLVIAGIVAMATGLVRADRTARAAERAGREVAQSIRTTNVVLVLSGVGLLVLGLVAMVT